MTSPALAVDGGPKIGRLYRRPGDPLPDRVQTDEDGFPFLRHRDARDAVLSGRLVPSVTNIIGVRNQPHLNPWNARLAAAEAVKTAREWPGEVMERPAAAIKWAAGAGDRDRDAASVTGDRVHKACEDIARGLACPPLTPDESKYVDAWRAWLGRWRPVFVALEVTVFGQTPDGLAYAGTGDLLFRAGGLLIVGDYKCTRSGLGENVALQLSAIAHATHMTTDGITLSPMPVMDAAVGIHLDPDGYQVKPAQIDGQVWDTFCALRQAWDFHALDGGLRDGSEALGQTLVGPEVLGASRKLVAA